MAWKDFRGDNDLPRHDRHGSDLFDNLGAHELALFKQQREEVDPGRGLRRVVTRAQRRRVVGVVLRGVPLQESNHGQLDLLHEVAQYLGLELGSVPGEDGDQKVADAVDGVRKGVQQCQASS